MAAHDQGWTLARKCSARVMVAERPVASASPGALVPAIRSSQLLPSTKPIDSALRSVLGAPHTHSSWPAASPMAMTASQSRTAWPSTSSSSGKTRASGCASRRLRRSDSSIVTGASGASEVTPAAAERCQDSATSARIAPRAVRRVMRSVDIVEGHLARERCDRRLSRDVSQGRAADVATTLHQVASTKSDQRIRWTGQVAGDVGGGRPGARER